MDGLTDNVGVELVAAASVNVLNFNSLAFGSGTYAYEGKVKVDAGSKATWMRGRRQISDAIN